MLSCLSIEGAIFPKTVFCDWQNQRCSAINSNDYFANKTVILFAVPGAFASLYSSLQALGYQKYFDLFRANGVDDILCVSVNDPFVMQAWMQAEGIDKVHMIPDGSGEFSRQLGMIVDKRSQGMGKRSKRYSMLVRNGLIEKVFLEPDDPKDSLAVSDARTMMNYINPNVELPADAAVLLQVWRTLLEPCKEKADSINYLDC
ncbi:MAG: peroxiredoxin [Leptolyngbya sp. LCM1.Bin17]|nr:MAG: peroxiredoxin [Leptolyngbya sp. LCM1.Bin17]